MDEDFGWPTAERAGDIHSRLCDRDPVAPSDLAVTFLGPLCSWLLRYNPSIDPHLCNQAAEDAILSLIKSPRSFQPSRGTLPAYLRMSAQGDLRNILESERRHSSRRAPLEVVELSSVSRNLLWNESDPARLIEQDRETDHLEMPSVPERVRTQLSTEEEGVLALMHQGQRRTETYAKVLGISHLPQETQRREVKRIKDRIKRRIERARGNGERES